MKCKFALVLCVALTLAACGGDDDENNANSANNAGDRATTIAGLTADANAGKTVYDQICATCHAADGSGTAAGDALTTSNFTKEQTIDIVLNGKGDMSAYGGTLDDQEIADVTAYSLTFQN